MSRLKPTSNSLRSQSTQASVLQSETYSSRQADTWSPRDGTIYLGADSPSHSCSHNLSSLSCSWEDTSAPKQTQAARLPGQVLASTKSRTCAASHFQAFRLNLKSREGRPRKSFGEDPHKEGQFSQCQGSKSDKLEAAPRLPGRVLEDTLSRTCAAAFLTHEPREPRSEQRSEPRSELRPKPQVPTQAPPKGKKEVNEPQPSMTPCPRRGELHRSESQDKDGLCQQEKSHQSEQRSAHGRAMLYWTHSHHRNACHGQLSPLRLQLLLPPPLAGRQ